METSVTFYNQAAADLASIRAWWHALPPSQQGTQETIDRLVGRAEQIMRAEHIGWVQEMQDAMTQFRMEQATDATAAGGADGGTEQRSPEDEDATGPALTQPVGSGGAADGRAPRGAPRQTVPRRAAGREADAGGTTPDATTPDGEAASPSTASRD
jgi:hypothetical protein